MEIIYQDNRIVVAVKPGGILSTDEEGGMPSLLRQELGTACFHTVHRLDAQVSGLMIYARSRKAASLLSQQIRDGQFRKEYLAVVHGVPPKSNILTDLLGRDRARRISYVADTPGKDVRSAALAYEVLHSQNGLSLVRIQLHTGRTHQIRVQFASRGWPLCGDRKYGIEDGTSSIALFSCGLSFIHPQSGERMTFSHLPPDAAPWSQFYTTLTSGER